MAEELQSLLDKINAEGVLKAEAEAARIIENAKKQAQDIRNEAEAAAAATMKNANEQAAALESRAEAAIKQKHIFNGYCVAPHSSTRAWKIPWKEEPGRLQSMGSLRVGHD